MHKYRKIIGVLISLADGIYQKKFIEGIQRQAYELDYDVLVFSSFIKVCSSKPWLIGEKNIYNTVNFDLLDAVIIATDTIQMPGVAQKIIDKIKKVYHKPVVSVEIDIDGFYSIFTDDVKPVKNIVSHLIEQHKLTDIAFVTGSKGHPHAAKRLEGYCEAMVEHDLPIDMSRVFYGDFWYTCGEEIVNQLLNDPRPLPQAIACGSDTMAIGICEALKKRGISVPQDIVVTGYDSVPAGITYYPCITSAVIPSQITGERAVKYIHSQITGTEFHDITDHSSEICIGQSCGCGISLNDRNNAKSGIWRDEDLGNDFISNNNYMLEGLLSESDMTNYIGTLNWFTYVLGDFEGFYLCLCDNWDNLNENEKAENYLKEGYTSRMNLVLEHGPTENDIHINTVHSFNLAEMLPCIYYKRDHPTTYFFTPVHFNDRCFGYSVISYGKAIRSYDGIYRMWIRYVNSSLESLRRQRKLKAMYRHMRENAITDTMTGIYNRNGFNLYADEIFNKAKTQNKKLLVMLCDINRLKYINDNFGHNQGDIAIKAAAKAVRSVCESTMMCFRIGGDEFIIIDTADYEPKQLNKIKNDIQGNMAESEKNIDHKYPLNVSVGIFYDTVDKFNGIEGPISVADKEMFSEKEKSKR